MKKRRWFAKSLLGLFLLSAFMAELKARPPVGYPEEQTRNTISGQVFDPQRRPISQIYVELQNDVYSILARTQTDGGGRFIFRNVSAGRFYIRVLPYAMNYEEQTQEVEIVNFVAPGRSVSENVQKDFYLRLRRNEAESNVQPGTIFIQEIPEQAQKFYKKAVAELDDKKIEAGIKELQNALDLFPDYFLALERLGNELIKLKKYAEALEIYQKAVAVNPRSYNCWYSLSYAAYGMKQSERAIEAAEKAVELNPKSAETVLMLGISQRQAARYEEAEKSLKVADTLAKGQLADAHWNLALLYAHNFKRYRDAADRLELYLKVRPNSENAEAVKKLIKQFREKPDGN